MAKHETPTPQPAGRVKDARSRSVTQLDPVKMHLLNLRTHIPTATLQAMVYDSLAGCEDEEVAPGSGRRVRFPLCRGR